MQSEAESKAGAKKSREKRGDKPGFRANNPDSSSSTSSIRASVKKEGKAARIKDFSKFPSSPAIDLDAVYAPSSPATDNDTKSNNNDNQRQSQQRLARPFSIGAGSQMRRYGGAPVKVLKVKNLRTGTTASSSGTSSPSSQSIGNDDAAERYFQETWKKLEQALIAVLEANPTSIFLEELYRAVENLCRAGKSKPLWELVYSQLERHFQEILGPNLWGKIAKASPEDVVILTNTAWQNWGDQARMVGNIFYYLDRSYLLRYSRDGDISAVCSKLFGEMLSKQQEGRIFQTYSNAILTLFNQQRVSNNVSPMLLASSLSMLNSLGLFNMTFLDELLQSTFEFYKQVSIEPANGPLQEFIKQCFIHLGNEGAILKSIGMDLEACNKVMDQVRNALLRDYSNILTSIENEDLSQFFDSVLGKLPDYSSDQSMANLNSMADNIITSARGLNSDSIGLFIIWYDMMVGVYPSRGEVATVWGEYIVQRGKMIVCDKGNEEKMIGDLLNFKFKIECIERKVFDVGKEWSEDIIRQGSRKKFEEFINIRKDGIVAEMIAKYLDGLLRRSSNSKMVLSETTNLEEQLTNILALFRFVYSKDIFEAFYKRYLTKRLLLNRSISIDAEESMIRKLTVECGPGFTQQLEQMFNDMQLSKELMIKCKESKSITSKVEFSANILSEASWPTIPNETVVMLPQEMMKTIEEFEEFYKSQHNGRRLSWRHTLGNCVIKANMKLGKKELVMSTFQAIIIQLFNEKDKLTFQEIKDESKLQDKELIRTLLSLACGKVHLLTKQPKTREIGIKDIFSINEKFNDCGGAYRIKINQIKSIDKNQQEEEEELLRVRNQVERDRQYEIQAAITRIMKTRKRLTHQELIVQTIDLIKLRGKPDISDIKKNIGKLLERDYITRLGNSNTYEYIA